MMVEPNHDCLREDVLQNHTIQLTELENRANFKEQRIEEMNSKLDELLKGFNEFKIQSTKDDTHLELRLTTMETELKNIKQELRDKEIEANNRINRQLVVIGLLFTAITIGLNVMFQYI